MCQHQTWTWTLLIPDWAQTYLSVPLSYGCNAWTFWHSVNDPCYKKCSQYTRLGSKVTGHPPAQILLVIQQSDIVDQHKLKWRYYMYFKEIIVLSNHDVWFEACVVRCYVASDLCKLSHTYITKYIWFVKVMLSLYRTIKMLLNSLKFITRSQSWQLVVKLNLF